MSNFSNEDRIRFVSGVRESRKVRIKNNDIVATVLGQHTEFLRARNITGYIMACYLDMLKLHRMKSKQLAIDLLQPIYDDTLASVRDAGASGTRTLLDKVYDYDFELHNSTGQSIRNARGYFLECALESLFDQLAPDQYMAQVKINHNLREKRIDFVVGIANLSDPRENVLYVTVKKSLRERGSQVVDERQFLGDVPLFYFHADDVKISEGNMEKFFEDDIVVVAPEYNVDRHYPDKKNVISYEKFFLELLPAYLADKANFKITNFGIETFHQKIQRPGFTLVRSNA